MLLEKKSQVIAARLYDACIAVDEGVRLSRTGELVPSENCRVKETRDAFQWVREITDETPRFFTKAAVQGAINILINDSDYPMSLPQTPDFCLSSWIDRQVAVVHKTIRAFRKQHPGCRARCGPDEAMDNAETQPWSEEWTRVCFSRGL